MAPESRDTKVKESIARLSESPAKRNRKKIRPQIPPAANARIAKAWIMSRACEMIRDDVILQKQ